LQDYDEIPGVNWLVDYTTEPPQRKALIEFDTNTLISLVDVANAASFSSGRTTRLNGDLFREYLLPIIQQLERRSLHDHAEWEATKHLGEVPE
jgi:hypothetical protein